MNKAQGTIEYLVILSIIIVIGLLTVGMASTFLDSTNQINQSATSTINKANIISLTEPSITPDGNYLIRLTNNTGDTLTISSVTIEDTTKVYSESLQQGSAQNFVIDSSTVCNVGSNTTSTVTLTYVTRYGITKTETYPTKILFDCENYTVDQIATKLSCDPDLQSCNSACSLPFVDNPTATWISEIAQGDSGEYHCYNSEGDGYEIGSDGYCDYEEVQGTDGLCAVFASGYICPSYERNGNVAVVATDCCDVTGADPPCYPDNPEVPVGEFDFSNEFFAGPQ